MKLTLRNYRSSDLEYLEKWITGPELLFQYAGPDFSYPLTRNQMNRYMKKHPERQFYMAEQGKEVVAFGEIIPQDHYSLRLARLLVGNKRGQGIGTSFVRALVNEAKNNYFVKKVDLYVIHDNFQAIRCYEKAGFSFEDVNPIYIRDQWGKEHRVLKMKRYVESVNK